MIVTERTPSSAGGSRCSETLVERFRSFWWELSVTYRLARMLTPELLSCEQYQQEQIRSAAKAAEVSRATQASDDLIGDTSVFWSIDMLAVDPNEHSKGSGREMISNVCALADQLGMTLRLDAAGQKNLNFYTRSGFAVVSDVEIKDPCDAIAASLRLYRMERIHRDGDSRIRHEYD